MSGVDQVNAVAFNLLFMQVAFKALEDSKTEDEHDHEAAFYRIEQLGYQVGQRLVERLLAQTQVSRLPEQIDVVKFLCKEFWMVAFGKGIDNLKTNHRGVFVLQDQNFQWISRFSVDGSNPATAKMAVLYLAFPCGMLRGALANMGIVTTVTAEIPSFPQCVFQIRTQSAAQ
ncbi:hypothetical protein PSACC_02761 [Paramicrosporidium saccamoebae]|uniref:Trafficking protein particle complex subunit 6B n=1 Tax=Paramicrosporidium saccamoebae TaxID=1246581 RepID=A0A2H9TIA0_9FUNG|nr:hypothetical protein PSACC_02761 [Paramicrosporidium saccamoebae]